MVSVENTYCRFNDSNHLNKESENGITSNTRIVRYYGPQAGRRLSRDPLGEVDGPNLHAFVGNTLAPPQTDAANWTEWLRCQNHYEPHVAGYAVASFNSVDGMRPHDSM